MNFLRLINAYVSAKYTWEILETSYEGTSKLKTSPLQLVTTKFKNPKMHEEDTTSEF